MIRRWFYHSLIAVVGLWVAVSVLDKVSFNGPTHLFIFASLALGFVNAFVKPLIKIVSFPLRLVTLGLFNFVINMITLEIVDIIFPELSIVGLIPLFITSLIISLGTLILCPKKQK